MYSLRATEGRNLLALHDIRLYGVSQFTNSEPALTSEEQEALKDRRLSLDEVTLFRVTGYAAIEIVGENFTVVTSAPIRSEAYGMNEQRLFTKLIAAHLGFGDILELRVIYMRDPLKRVIYSCSHDAVAAVGV
jgi:hypothetical protein